METKVTIDEGSGFAGDPEAERFFSRVGPVSLRSRGDKPIDFAALNREFDEYERGLPARILEQARRRKEDLLWPPRNAK